MLKSHAGAFLSAAILLTATQVVVGEVGQPSRSLVVDIENLELVREAYRAGDAEATTDVNYLLYWANRYLDVEPVSVVHSELVAPSGDPKDYVDYAAYWWPNPDTEDGTPWIRRDGHVNEDNYADFTMLQDLSRWTEALGPAYYITGDERYAAKTGELLRTWFTDPVTGMNPRNEYSQMKPSWKIGDYNVAGLGNRFQTVFDAAGLIESSASWTAADKSSLQEWSTDFVEWTERSSIADKQFVEPSNHGTNYDYLKTLFLVYAEEYDAARDAASHYFENRMPGQIDEDGSNPYELLRANNLLYHRYNLGRALDLAELTRHIPDFDGINYETEDGRSLKLALEYLIPYMTGEKVWDKFPGDPFPTEPLLYYFLMLRGAHLFNDADSYQGAVDSIYSSLRFSNINYPDAAITINGDYDGDRLLTVDDIDAIAEQVRRSVPDLAFDLNSDGQVTHADIFKWVRELKKSVPGDSNLDGQFNTIDLVDIMTTGLYEDAIALNANWTDGDWNGDGDFSSADFVAIMTDGIVYEGGDVARAQAVPEPGFVCLVASPFLFAVGFALRVRRATHSH